MITDSFDNKSEAIISPRAFLTFSREILANVLDRYPHEIIGEIKAVNHIRSLYLIEVDGMKLGFYFTEVGSMACSTDIIEVNWKIGADKFILFGSCGDLDPDKTSGKYIIPTAAYRDEGMSYHYAPPSDYIDIRNADLMATWFEEMSLPYVKGRVWTTDAIYMETRDLVDKRKKEGCIAVEMELAGVQAVCDYYGFELYDFLCAGDIVDQSDYTPDGLHDANHSPDKFDVAVKIAKRIADDGSLSGH